MCKADKCKLTCCKGWIVLLDKKTYKPYKADDNIEKSLSKKIGKLSRCGETFGSIKLKKMARAQRYEMTASAGYKPVWSSRHSLKHAILSQE